MTRLTTLKLMKPSGTAVQAALLVFLSSQFFVGCNRRAVGSHCNITVTVSDVVVQVCDEKDRVLHTARLKLFSHTITGEDFQRVREQTVTRQFGPNTLVIERNGAEIKRVTLNDKELSLKGRLDPLDKLVADSMSKDPAVREKTEAAMSKLSPADRKEFDRRRRLLL